MVAWKEPIEQRALDASGMRGVVIVSGVAYGDGGGGVPGLLLGSPRDDDGNLIMLGTGQQHWPTVHVADLADFFRRALEDDSARGHYVVGDGLNPTVAELTEAAAVAAGAPGAVPGSDDEARARLGDYFAEVLLLDQGTDAAKARAELDWSRPIRDLSTSSATGATARRQTHSDTRSARRPPDHPSELGTVPRAPAEAVSTEQRENLDAILRQSAFPADSDVNEQRRLLRELLSAQPLPADVTVTAATLGGVPTAEITVDGIEPRHVVLYFHGGVYVTGGRLPRR